MVVPEAVTCQHTSFIQKLIIDLNFNRQLLHAGEVASTQEQTLQKLKITCYLEELAVNRVVKSF